jgi:hypothetical protein
VPNAALQQQCCTRMRGGIMRPLRRPDAQRRVWRKPGGGPEVDTITTVIIQHAIKPKAFRRPYAARPRLKLQLKQQLALTWQCDDQFINYGETPMLCEFRQIRACES